MRWVPYSEQVTKGCSGYSTIHMVCVEYTWHSSGPNSFIANLNAMLNNGLFLQLLSPLQSVLSTERLPMIGVEAPSEYCLGSYIHRISWLVAWQVEYWVLSANIPMEECAEPLGRRFQHAHTICTVSNFNTSVHVLLLAYLHCVVPHASPHFCIEIIAVSSAGKQLNGVVNMQSPWMRVLGECI